MPFVAGKDQSADRVRYQEDELVVERAKCAAEIIRENIRRRGIGQAQYCSVFGFKAQQTIHNHFRSGKVTLIDLIRIVSTSGFNISIDDALRQAIAEIEYIDQSVVPVEEPRVESKKTEEREEEEPRAEKPLKRPSLLDEEIDMSALKGTSFERFEKLFSGVLNDEETD